MSFCYAFAQLGYQNMVPGMGAYGPSSFLDFNNTVANAVATLRAAAPPGMPINAMVASRSAVGSLFDYYGSDVNPTSWQTQVRPCC